MTAVVPFNGGTYTIASYVSPAAIFDIAGIATSDNTPIIVSKQGSSTPNNQIWEYQQYPNSVGQTVFTLQNVYTKDTEPLGQGAYARVNGSLLVQGGAPFAWRLEQVATYDPTIFRLRPFDPEFGTNSAGQGLVAEIMSIGSQLALEPDLAIESQWWQFYTANPN